MAERRPTRVPNNEQLEQLTQLRVRAIQCAERHEWIQQTFTQAIKHVGTAMAAIDNCYQRPLLHQLSAKEDNDEWLQSAL